MGLQIPLLIIDPRGVSIMSALFMNRRVTHLIYTDIQLEQKFHAEKKRKAQEFISLDTETVSVEILKLVLHMKLNTSTGFYVNVC